MFAFAFVIALMVIGGLVVVAWWRRGSTEGGARMARAMVTGAFWAAGLAFPLAAACALVYRFPVPMAGYASGPTSLPRVLLSVVFYGLLGGFPALLAAGAAAGAGAYALGQPDPRRVLRLVPALAGLVAALGVGILAILDKLIGPW